MRHSRLWSCALAVLGACGVAGAQAARPAHEEVSGFALPVRLGLGELGFVTLRFEPANAAGSGTRFVRGDLEHGDQTLNFDAASVRAFTGRVDGHPGSSAFLVETPFGARGWLNHEGHWFRLSPEAGGSVVAEPSPAGGWTGLLTCGVEPPPGWTPPIVGDGAAPTEGPDVLPGRRVVDLAVETDYELYELFGDADATAAYVAALYSEVSAIMDRDIQIRLNLVFVRVWDDPNDLFTNGDPLGSMRNYWNANMGHIQRDCVQFFSGQRDFTYGGVAWVSSLCGSHQYSVVGYAEGHYDTPNEPSVFNRDVIVTAHELGHNFGTLHTHDYSLDDCQQADGVARRGTIMSYCGQTRMGGEANLDPRFDTFTAARIREYLAQPEVACPIHDCDGNGIDDAADITAAPGRDGDGNGVLDVCEDCDGDGILNSTEIAQGAPDLDGNGVPDVCEPDCDGDGLPDRFEVAQGAADIDRDGVPDSCWVDCDGNQVPDLNQIYADMGLDINRNLVLDACEDCDGDGATDLAELNHEHGLIVGTLSPARDLRRFHGRTGVRTGVSVAAAFDQANDLIITPDRRVLVSSGADDRIVEFDVDGNLVGTLVPAGFGGLDEPAGMVLLSDGTFLVASRANHQVLRFALADGEFVGVFVAPGSGGLSQPFGLFRTGGGTLLVSTGDDRVLEFDDTGAFMREVVGPGSGGLLGARGLVIKRDGNLLVAGTQTKFLFEYDYLTGAPLGAWNRNGSNDVLEMGEPWCVRVGADYNIYVSDAHAGHEAELHLTAARVYKFDFRNGNYLAAVVQGNDTGLAHPSGFDFIPGAGQDCNRTFFPDACEIASGFSRDTNNDGVPDECQNCPADFTGAADPNDPGYGIPDGALDASDFFYFLDLFVANLPAADLTTTSDINSPLYGMPDGALDASDFFYFLDRFTEGC